MLHRPDALLCPTNALSGAVPSCGSLLRIVGCAARSELRLRESPIKLGRSEKSFRNARSQVRWGEDFSLIAERQCPSDDLGTHTHTQGDDGTFAIDIDFNALGSVPPVA